MPAAPELPKVPAEAILAFLKQASIEPSFDTAYLASTLKISAIEARQVLAVLLAAGYIQESGARRYKITESGDSAAGAKAPRRRRTNIDKAVAGLQERIARLNSAGGPLHVEQAVALGQYLTDHDVIQDVDIGVEFIPAHPPAAQLKELRARSAALNLREFAPWMEQIRHVRIWPVSR